MILLNFSCFERTLKISSLFIFIDVVVLYYVPFFITYGHHDNSFSKLLYKEEGGGGLIRALKNGHIGGAGMNFRYKEEGRG